MYYNALCVFPYQVWCLRCCLYEKFLGVLSYQTHQAGAQVYTCTAVFVKCGSKPFNSWELQGAQNCPSARFLTYFYQGTAHRTQCNL